MADKPVVTTLNAELSKDGGGFLYVELVPKAALGPLVQAGATRPVKAHLEVPLSASPLTNFPPEKIPCFVHWLFFDKTGWIEGGGASLDGATGAVTPSLDLNEKMANAGLGAVLEGGGPFSVRITPDHPYTAPAALKIPNAARAALPELSLTLSWHGEPGRKLTQMSKGKGLLLGDLVDLKLVRSSWKCPVRLHVSTRMDGGGSASVDIDFGTSGTSGRWRVGYDHEVLHLPASRTYDKSPPDIRYDLELQVSDDDGASYSTVTRGTVSLGLPKITSLKVVLGEGATAALERGDPEWWAPADALDLVSDHGVRVAGTISNIAAGAPLPFLVELWGYSATPPGFMHPLSSHRVHLGALDANGAFDTEVDRIEWSGDVATFRGLELFAVLRPETSGGDLQPMASSLAYDPLRLFGDEDFAPKPPGLGVASLGTGVNATREPVVRQMRWEIDRASQIFLSCDVLGSAQTWQGAKIVLATPDKPRAKELTAKYAPTGGSTAKGVVTAAWPLSDAAAIAGARVTATLEPATKAQVDPGGGTVSFDAKPRISGVKWWVDQDSAKKPRIHFVVETEFFPRDGKNLDVVLQTLGEVKTANASALGLRDEPATVLTYGPAKNVVDPEGKLHAYVQGAEVARILPLLGTANMKVSRPAKLEKLYNIDGFTVVPWSGPPVPTAPPAPPK